MKILHILHSLKYSGAEIMYAGAADEFKKRGCELVVMASAEDLGDYAPVFKASGYEVVHYPYPNNILSRWIYYFRMVRYVKDNNIDVIHIHSSAMKWGMSMVAKIAGIKSIYTFHNCFVSRPITKLWHSWLRWSAKNVFGCKFQTISDSVYANELNYWHNTTTKIYNWYNNTRFYPSLSGEKEQLRKEFGIPQDAIVLISVGGCSHIKRHSEIINILPELRKKHPNIIYLHLGEGMDTNDEIKMSEENLTKDIIRFIGNTQEVRKYLIASDIYLMTSKFEGIPITTIEAMACKIPAVLYDVAGLRDFNKESECAVIVKPEQSALMEGIESVISSPEIRVRHITNAYELVTSKFYMPTNTEKIFQLYQA